MIKQSILILVIIFMTFSSVKSQEDCLKLYTISSLIGGFGNVFKTNSMMEGDNELGLPIENIK